KQINGLKNGKDLKWKGALTTEGRGLLQRLTNQKDTLLSHKKDGVTTAKLENMTKENEAAAKGNENANLVRFVIALIELIIMFGCYYVEKYEHTVFMEVEFNSNKKKATEPSEKEAKETQPKHKKNGLQLDLENLLKDTILQKILGVNKPTLQEQTTLAQVENVQPTVSEPTDKVPTKIGFTQPNKLPTKQLTIYDEANKVKSEIGSEKNCLHCASTYKVKVAGQKYCTTDCRIESKDYPPQVKEQLKARAKGKSK
ncbi:MAG: hypothetical protein ACKVTZ_01165, partial [Bacteroidia bacterium]